MPAVRLSRYEYAPVHQDEHGRLFLDVPDPIPRRNRNDDTRAIIGHGDTLYALAWRAYRETLDREQDIRPTGFFWVIAQLNDVVDATVDPEAGTVFSIPSVQSLVGEILAPPKFYDRNEDL